jgi:transcription antitermination factor NusG
LPEIAATCLENFHPSIVTERLTGVASWLAVYTSSRHEKSVVKHFEDRDIENFLPLYRKQHHWNKRAMVELELPLFPNYVFVHIPAQQRIPLLGIPGVLGIVGGRVPYVLPDAEIEALRAGLTCRRFEPHPYLIEGERVRIRSGVMAGMEGILLRHKNELRVVLTIALIQRSVVAEMDATDVEPVSTRRA